MHVVRRRVFWLLLCLSGTSFLVVDGACANMCSGHGTCGAANSCTCDSAWNVVPDCSRRACPKGVAWVDKASAANVAHASATECSGRGVCDYSQGTCICAPGYTGEACQRSQCPNTCSGHGLCLPLASLALLYGPQSSTTGIGPTYTNWEANEVGGCYCDMGYTGPDCSMRMCPKNDDPLTTGQSYRTISLTVAAMGSALAGSISVAFNGYSFTMPANGNANSNSICTKGVQTLANVAQATCTMGAVDATTGGATYTIVFKQWTIVGAENNVFFHSGNPSLSLFTCNVVGVTSANSPTCTFADVVTTNLIEHAFCSNRGRCDFTVGLCTCFLDYKRLDCSQLSNIPDNIDDHDGFLINPTGPTYVGAALHILTAKAIAPDFRSIQIDAATQNVFYMLGTGDTFWNVGNVWIKVGTLFVQLGGVNIQDGGLTTTYTALSGTVADAVATHVAFVGTTLTARSTRAAAANFYLFQTYTSGRATVMFDVRGDGLTTVHTGGLQVLVGGATVSDNQPSTPVLLVQVPHATYSGSALVVVAIRASQYPATDFTLLELIAGGTTSFAVEASGKTTLTNGGLFVNGVGGANVINADPSVSAATILSSSGSFVGTVLTVGTSIASAATFFLFQAQANAAPIFTIRGDGFTKIYGGGFELVSGGATIDAGGLYVNGGATVNSGGLKVNAAGATIYQGGLVVVDGGADITDTAQLIPAIAGHSSHAAFQSTVARFETTVLAAATTFYLLELKAAGAQIMDVRGDGRTTVRQGGFVVMLGGATISANGLTVTAGGFTVADGGESITSTLTTGAVTTITASNTGYTTGAGVLQVISATSAASTFYLLQAWSGTTTPIFDIRGDGLTTVYTGGFVVTAGGLTVTAGGVTITAGGLLVTAGGFTVTDNGETITTTSTSASVAIFTASSPSYTNAGTVVQIVSGTAPATTFFLLKALSSTSTSMFDIRGDGQTTVRAGGLVVTAGGLTVTAGGVTITANGLLVTAGGFTVTDGGETITTTSTSASAAILTASSPSYTNGGTVVQIVSGTAPASTFYLLKALSSTSTSMFDVRGDGQTTVQAGGLVVNAGGLTVTAGGVTITANGLLVTAGGFTVTDGGETITTTSTSASAALLTASSPSYTNGGTVVQIVSGTAPASTFYLLKALSSTSTSMFDVRGDGQTTVRAGGLIVTAGGFTVTDGGETITTTSTSASAAIFTASSSSYTSAGTVVQIVSGTTPATTFYLLKALSSTSTAMFDVRGDGQTTVHAGGLIVTAGGLTVTAGGVTITANGLLVTAGGFTVTDGGETITTTSTSASAAILTASSPSYTNGGTVVQIVSGTAPASTFYLLKALSSTSTAMFDIRGDGQTTVRAGGLVVTVGGLTVTAGGVTITADGLLVTAGGFTVTDGGETITTTSATASAAVFTASSSSYTSAGTVVQIVSGTAPATTFYLLKALSSTSTSMFDVRGDGQTTVRAGGLVVTAGGLSVTAGGLTVTAGGLTITAGGLLVTAGGATVTDGGASVTTTSTSASAATFTASSSSYTSSGTVVQIVSGTASATTFYLLKALSSTTTSMFDVRGDGQTTVRAGGLVVTAGGLTVTAGGLTITANGLLVTA
ncbi:hypothetical protein As57867_020163, partial [Aphanomyces stellatus]